MKSQINALKLVMEQGHKQIGQSFECEGERWLVVGHEQLGFVASNQRNSWFMWELPSGWATIDGELTPEEDERLHWLAKESRAQLLREAAPEGSRELVVNHTFFPVIREIKNVSHERQLIAMMAEQLGLSVETVTAFVDVAVEEYLVAQSDAYLEELRDKAEFELEGRYEINPRI